MKTLLCRYSGLKCVHQVPLRGQPLQNSMDLATNILGLLFNSMEFLCVVLEFLFQPLQTSMRKSFAAERTESPPWRHAAGQLLQSIANTPATLIVFFQMLDDVLWQNQVAEHAYA